LRAAAESARGGASACVQLAASEEWPKNNDAADELNAGSCSY
jgi:hypothetical protein